MNTTGPATWFASEPAELQKYVDFRLAEHSTKKQADLRKENPTVGRAGQDIIAYVDKYVDEVKLSPEHAVAVVNVEMKAPQGATVSFADRRGKVIVQEWAQNYKFRAAWSLTPSREQALRNAAEFLASSALKDANAIMFQIHVRNNRTEKMDTKRFVVVTNAQTRRLPFSVNMAHSEFKELGFQLKETLRKKCPRGTLDDYF